MGQLVAGRYRVVRPLAAGGISHVWLALDKRTGRQVAVKRLALPDGLAESEQELVRRWITPEAEAFARVHHPSVIRILEVVPDGDEPWLVMEYLPSRSLQQLVRRSGPVAPVRAAEIGLAVLDGLAAAGRAGVLHLDVKPGNVLVADDGRVVLSDFGPAVTPAGIAALTGAGIILGSPNYIAPERLFDSVSTTRSDLWSLGATLAFAVTGRPPFLRDDTDETLRALADPAPDLPPGPLGEVVGGLLRRDPADRLDAEQVAAGLRAIAAGPGPAEVQAAEVAVAAAETPSDARIVVSAHAAATADPRPVPRSAARPLRRRLAVAATVAAAGGLLTAAALAAPDRRAPENAAPPSAAASAGVFELPAGWVWQSGEDGYRVATPQGWTAGAVGAKEAFTAPGGRPSLQISEWDAAPGDLIPGLVGEEQKVEAEAYRRLEIRSAAEPPGAVWEYIYVDSAGVAMRCLQRVLTAGGRTYRIEWRAARDDWAAELAAFGTVLDSFEGRRGA